MAKWSPIWAEFKGGFTTKSERDSLLRQARFTPPSPAKKNTKGQFPHQQKAGAK